MAVTTIDQYQYSTIEFADQLKYIKVHVDSTVDPVISDIESKLIDSNNNVYLEGNYYMTKSTFIKKIGSATFLMLEVQ